MRIEFWQNESGRNPVLEFIGGQPNNAAGRITKVIGDLERHGMKLIGSSKMKPLTGYQNLYELIIDFKGVFYRIVFCIVENTGHMLEAFKKKKNRTPERHIKVALARQQSLRVN